MVRIKVALWTFLSLLVLTSSCNYITIVHTQGEADDVVDEDQSAHPDISPDVKVDMPGAVG